MWIVGKEKESRLCAGILGKEEGWGRAGKERRVCGPACKEGERWWSAVALAPSTGAAGVGAVAAFGVAAGGFSAQGTWAVGEGFRIWGAGHVTIIP